MVNVPRSESPRKKYVNPNEVNEGINLINTLSGDYNISSMLVITPVSRKPHAINQSLRHYLH